MKRFMDKINLETPFASACLKEIAVPNFLEDKMYFYKDSENIIECEILNFTKGLSLSTNSGQLKILFENGTRSIKVDTSTVFYTKEEALSGISKTVEDLIVNLKYINILQKVSYLRIVIKLFAEKVLLVESH